MDVFKKIKFDQIEFGLKIFFQTAIVFVGFFGNIYMIYTVFAKSKLPRSTNGFIIALSVALFLQTMVASIDYVNHLHNQEDYALGYTLCDTWHTLNIYMPMVLALLCFFALMDRLVLLARPDLHARFMNSGVVLLMVTFSFVLPIVVTIPPVYFEWHTTESILKWRTVKECKFRTNLAYAILSPLITFWMPMLLVTIIIAKIFKTMDHQDRVVAEHLTKGTSCEKKQEVYANYTLPYKGLELQRQQRLALTLWSIYWNVALFWVPQFAWQYIYKLTGADWPKATNFMAWAGYAPSLILPCLYNYFDVYNMFLVCMQGTDFTIALSISANNNSFKDLNIFNPTHCCLNSIRLIIRVIKDSK